MSKGNQTEAKPTRTFIVSVPQVTPKGNVRWHDFEIEETTAARAKRHIADRTTFFEMQHGLRGHLSNRTSEYSVRRVKE